MRYTHPCIKCRDNYESDEPDAFYCEKCNVERKKIAAQVDKKLAGRVDRNVVSDLQAYDQVAVKLNTPDGRQVSFLKVKL